MKVSIWQEDIVWEDKQRNMQKLHKQLETLRGTTEMLVMPEMFSTGFSMNSPLLAERTDESTITTLQTWAREYQIALVGSYIAADNGKYFNRAFFLTPEGDAYFYDKRHLFRMGNERDNFSAGNQRLIIPYCGWNICLLVCYDLRFPVWSRNYNNAYDLLIYVANWPASRRRVWDTLLAARSLENMCCVCGANRIGTDANGLHHNGGSIILSAKGETLAKAPDDQETVITTDLNLEELRAFRKKFPAWQDADLLPYNL
jgi:predicted amidohydrolase